jgi:hypothetical protein
VVHHVTAVVDVDLAQVPQRASALGELFGRIAQPAGDM